MTTAMNCKLFADPKSSTHHGTWLSSIEEDCESGLIKTNNIAYQVFPFQESHMMW